MTPNHIEQRARDALAFDPLPTAFWLRGQGENGLEIAVNYSEELSSLLRSLPGAKWDAPAKVWRLPYSSTEALRACFGRVDMLARVAKERSDVENSRRKKEREDRARIREQETKKRDAERLAARPRPLRPEFLTVMPGPMFALRLEAIGDDATEFGMPSRNWVAQIVGLSANGRWARAYLNGARDYSRANSAGSRGIMVTYLLDPGLIYEVAEPKTWSTRNHWFCRVIGFEIVKMTENEVRECLAN